MLVHGYDELVTPRITRHGRERGGGEMRCDSRRRLVHSSCTFLLSVKLYIKQAHESRERSIWDFHFHPAPQIYTF